MEEKGGRFERTVPLPDTYNEWFHYAEWFHCAEWFHLACFCGRKLSKLTPRRRSGLSTAETKDGSTLPSGPVATAAEACLETLRLAKARERCRSPVPLAKPALPLPEQQRFCWTYERGIYFSCPLSAVTRQTEV